VESQPYQEISTKNTTRRIHFSRYSKSIELDRPHGGWSHPGHPGSQNKEPQEIRSYRKREQVLPGQVRIMRCPLCDDIATEITKEGNGDYEMRCDCGYHEVIKEELRQAGEP